MRHEWVGAAYLLPAQKQFASRDFGLRPKPALARRIAIFRPIPARIGGEHFQAAARLHKWPRRSYVWVKPIR
jgi:hypothetical protein